MEDDDDSVSDLFCGEDGDDRGCFESNPDLGSEDDDEFVADLVRREAERFGSENRSVAGGGSRSGWLKSARFDAVDWIFNTRSILGFRLRTAFLAIAYLDGFLSNRSIDEGKSWAVRLLSVACLSLAAKMEEWRVPALSEFAAVEGFDFEGKVVQRMELMVLTTLEWRLGLITPFAYLHYFIGKFRVVDDDPSSSSRLSSRSSDLASRAVELMVDLTKEVNLMDHRPSIIAAAAVLAASDNQLTRSKIDLKMSTILSCGSLENEHIFSCYNLMQESATRKIKTPKSVISPSIASSSADQQKNPSPASHSGSGTRRRLAFSDTDQNCPIKKIRRL